MTLTDFRETLRARLQTQLGFEFAAGSVHGPIEDRKLGCVFVANGAVDQAEQDINVGIRVFPQWKTEEPRADAAMVAELEAVPDQVNDALKAIQTQPGAGFWFFSIQRFDIDYEQEWGTEVQVLLRRENPFLP